MILGALDERTRGVGMRPLVGCREAGPSSSVIIPSSSSSEMMFVTVILVRWVIFARSMRESPGWVAISFRRSRRFFCFSPLMLIPTSLVMVPPPFDSV